MNIHFHVLEKSNNQQALLHVCQLVEKHHQANEKVYIHTASPQEADRLDQLLWTFKDDSFIAHQVYEPGNNNPPSVLIGYDAAHATRADILINLSNTFPDFLDHYSQAVEIVFADPTVQQLARERFKKYRELGYEIKTHKWS